MKRKIIFGTIIALLLVLSIGTVAFAYGYPDMKWAGVRATAPSSPENGTAYRNSTLGASYVRNSGVWDILALDGTPGPQGPVGPAGSQGIQGIAGTNGTNGTNGIDGKDGYTPIKGVDYFDGAKGDTGLQGPPGVADYRAGESIIMGIPAGHLTPAIAQSSKVVIFSSPMSSTSYSVSLAITNTFNMPYQAAVGWYLKVSAKTDTGFTVTIYSDAYPGSVVATNGGVMFDYSAFPWK